MSYESATNQLINTVEAIPASALTRTGDMGAAFRHDPDFDPANPDTYPKADRTFALLGGKGATDLRSYGEASRTQFDEVTLTVIYGAKRSVRDLDVAIRQDYAVIRAALLDQSNWGQPSSGIVNINTGGIEGTPFNVTTIGDGRKALQVAIDLRHSKRS